MDHVPVTLNQCEFNQSKTSCTDLMSLGGASRLAEQGALLSAVHGAVLTSKLRQLLGGTHGRMRIFTDIPHQGLA